MLYDLEESLNNTKSFLFFSDHLQSADQSAGYSSARAAQQQQSGADEGQCAEQLRGHYDCQLQNMASRADGQLLFGAAELPVSR